MKRKATTAPFLSMRMRNNSEQSVEYSSSSSSSSSSTSPSPLNDGDLTNRWCSDVTASLATPSESKLRLRDWLLEQVGQRTIPGLMWIDEDRTLLRIPWIHASKSCWSRDDHCKLFEKWATYTGKFRPGIDTVDTKRWKANFRCALNSLDDVHEETPMSCSNGIDGFKVYRFLPPSARRTRRSMSVAEKRRQPPVVTCAQTDCVAVNDTSDVTTKSDDVTAVDTEPCEMTSDALTPNLELLSDMIPLELTSLLMSYIDSQLPLSVTVECVDDI